MQNFKAECKIHVHVAALGRPAKYAWACSVEAHGKPMVMARGFLGMVARETAEEKVLAFGLEQAQRLLQEKVEVSASFATEDWLESDISGRGRAGGLQSEKAKLRALWQGFRLRRLAAGGVPSALKSEAERAFERKRKKERK